MTKIAIISILMLYSLVMQQTIYSNVVCLTLNFKMHLDEYFGYLFNDPVQFISLNFYSLFLSLFYQTFPDPIIVP